MKRVLWFVTACICICVCCGAASSFALYDGDVIVAFGDSLTYAGVWCGEFEQSTGQTVINKGVGGDSTGTAYSRFRRDVLNNSPDVVIIEFGMNDSAIDMAKYVELSDFRKNLEYFVDKSLESGAFVILVTPNPVGESDYYTRHDKAQFEPYGGINAFLDLYVEVIREVSEDKKVRLADVHAAFDATGNPESYLTDGVHCTRAGYSIYASVIEEAYYRLVSGDVDGDGRLSSVDYIMTKRAVLGTYFLDVRQQSAADVDKNGDVAAIDYIMIKRAVLGTTLLD